MRKPDWIPDWGAPIRLLFILAALPLFLFNLRHWWEDILIHEFTIRRLKREQRIPDNQGRGPA